MNKIKYLDLIRGIAALLVLLCHERAIIFKPLESTNTNIIYKLFIFVCGFGHQSVIIFFVLSGYFISKVIYSKIRLENWNVSDYLFDRITRLWIVLIPCLLITYLLDSIGLYLASNAPGYHNLIPNLPETSPLNRLDLLTFLGNTSFLQTIYFPVYGSNTPLWSLSNEFWYYISFPALLFALKIDTSHLKRFLLTLLSLFLIYIMPFEMKSYFTIWLMGAFAGRIQLIDSFYSIIQKTFYSVISILFFILILILTRLNINPTLFNDFSLGAVTSLLILILLNKKPPKSIEKISIFLSNISYSMYAVHFPFLILITSFFSCNDLEWNGRNALKYIIIFSATFVFSYFFYWVFERNTENIRTKLKIYKNRFGS